MDFHYRFSRGALLREAITTVTAVLAYFLVRGLTEGSTGLAVENAMRVADLQDALGLAWEGSVQETVLGHDWLVTLANWVYIFGHWPVIVCGGLWLALRHPRTYFLTRNAFLISGLIGLVVFVAFPTAPPRLANLELIDTVTQRSSAYRLLQPPALVNQYAAMPSLHFGWDLLLGIGLARELRRPVLRGMALTLPAVMAVAVVATANHFVLDVFAGGIVAMAGLWLALRIRPRSPDWLWGGAPRHAR
ncbi:MAG: phosphatase PAP2 family protein [Dehalococcoidia bacterium]